MKQPNRYEESILPLKQPARRANTQLGQNFAINKKYMTNIVTNNG